MGDGGPGPPSPLVCHVPLIRSAARFARRGTGGQALRPRAVGTGGQALRPWTADAPAPTTPSRARWIQLRTPPGSGGAEGGVLTGAERAAEAAQGLGHIHVVGTARPRFERHFRP